MKVLVWLRASWRQERERWLLGAAAVLLAACLMRPTLPMQRALFEHVVVLDITQSMNVLDQQLDGKPASRLAFAKHALHQALLQLPCGSRLGWAIFTEYRSYLLFAPVEVCANSSELRATLARIDGRMAWTGNSEIAKGLFSGIGIAGQLPGKPALVFVSDGHEAPPVSPQHRPVFNDKRGELPGLIVGVGGLTPMPIPKIDPAGRPLGYWAADEVAQSDPRSQGRGGSVAGERMAEDPNAPPAPAALAGQLAGREHLSSLHEGYLRLLAGETGLGYLRLQSAEGLAQALMAPDLARPVPARFDLRLPLALLALLCLLARYARAWPSRLLTRAISR